MEFQKAYLTIKDHHLRMKNKKLPNISKYGGSGLKLIITTGIDALGRNNEALKKDLFFEKLKQIADITQMLGLNIEVVAQSYANDLGLNIEGYFKTREELKTETEEAQNNAALSNIAPEIIKQAGSMIQNSQKQEQGLKNVE